jgi:hypothetical protein
MEACAQLYHITILPLPQVTNINDGYDRADLSERQRGGTLPVVQTARATHRAR